MESAPSARRLTTARYELRIGVPFRALAPGPRRAGSRKPRASALEDESQVTSNVTTAGAAAPVTDAVIVYVPTGAHFGTVNFRSFVRVAFAGTSTEMIPCGPNAAVGFGGTSRQVPRAVTSAAVRFVIETCAVTVSPRAIVLGTPVIEIVKVGVRTGVADEAEAAPTVTAPNSAPTVKRRKSVRIAQPPVGVRTTRR